MSEIKRDNRWRLSSPAAYDMRWFFRCAAAAMGVSASRFELPAETVRRPDRYECRHCKALSPGRPGSKCVHCGKLLVDFDRVVPNPSRAPASQATTEKTDRVLIAVANERRIRAGLVRLPRATYALLERAYTARQHTPEIRRVLGDFADLAMRSKRCQNAYAKYCEACADDGESPLELEVWLTKRCRSAGKADRALANMREETERAIGDALAEYQAVRVRPGAGTVEIKLHQWAVRFTWGQVRGKRRTGQRGGIQFIPGGDDA